MSESNMNKETSILDKDELIKSVIAKHKRLLEEYNKEFSELDTRSKALKEQIESSKQKKEDTLTRIEVLKEKRQQLYHQAENVLGNMFTDIDDKLLDNKLMHAANDGFTKVRRLIDISEEKQVVDELLTKLNGMSTHETVQNSVQQIKAKVNGAIEASNELAGTIGIKALEEGFHKASEELKTISPRHGWLENRIKSHNEALEHWEKNPATEENTTEADA
ncbi:hypothetical protein HNV12_08930 [Methanococcoides sp. SA1]|nr:hypothetical protein [Methanococcoides sp. SA1]